MAENRTEEKPVRCKTALAIISGILLSLAILAFSDFVTQTGGDNPCFSYSWKSGKDTPVHIIAGETVEIPFEFQIHEGVSRIGLEFTAVHSGLHGILLSKRFVGVENGRAKSEVIFRMVSHRDLEPGSHILTIVARDAGTGRVLRKGEIPFAFNMIDVISKCSC